MNSVSRAKEPEALSLRARSSTAWAPRMSMIDSLPEKCPGRTKNLTLPESRGRRKRALAAALPHVVHYALLELGAAPGTWRQDIKGETMTSKGGARARGTASHAAAGLIALFCMVAPRAADAQAACKPPKDLRVCQDSY